MRQLVGNYGVRGGMAAVLALAAGLAGCANPAMPKPPTLNLPQLAGNVTAERAGDQVRVRWTTPSETTDKLKIKGPVTAVICREGSGKAAPCAPLGRTQVGVGASETVVTLPADLLAGPARAVRLRVELENDRGRSAGESEGRPDAVLVAAGAAPATVEGLTATGTREGALVRWQQASDGSEVELQRVLVEAAPEPVKAEPPVGKTAKRAGAKSSGAKTSGARTSAAAAVTLRAEGPDAGGMLDAGVERLARYRYTAQRVQRVTADGHELEIRGPETVAVEFTYRDTFAPEAPAGLAAIPATTAPGPSMIGSIDLSWEASSATDIAGYNVYRRDAGGLVKRLTAEPVVAAAFRDRTAAAGATYTYWVTAVDAAGNESKPSGEVTEKLP